ncbi:hypothetical protein HHI36_007398 [Cryptolaemus montrouzieri]|uniref:BHLH domain-containing protein n=1 Tax=Cryptolaemus montrouzieri TaxID=559131 RepID=A0ABD2MPJ1_9CUCU
MTAVSDKKSWEKERRDRLKVAFTNLEKLLPSYDPSSVSTRINVLTKSIEYIQEMQNKIQELLKPNSKINAEVLQLKKLQDRIKRLVSRNELLSTLLREAKIPIPNQGSTLKNFKYVYKWSGKINEKTASILQKRAERIKENEKENKDLVGQSKTQKKTRSKSNSCSWVPKHRKTIVNRVTSKNDGQTKKKSLQSATTNCLIINTQPCYLVTNAPSTNFRSTSQTDFLQYKDDIHLPQLPDYAVLWNR